MSYESALLRLIEKLEAAVERVSERLASPKGGGGSYDRGLLNGYKNSLEDAQILLSLVREVGNEN